MPPTLILLNPHAASGQTRSRWEHLEPLLRRQIGDLIVKVTDSVGEIPSILRSNYQDHAIRHVIAVGGDGTNHTAINAVLAVNEANPHDPLIYGNLPVGTGRDWARGIGIPTSHSPLIDWVGAAAPTATDVGSVTIHDRNFHEYFLNIASLGLGGDVVRRVNHVKKRRAWTFYWATVRAILTYQPQTIRVKLDGNVWYEGKSYLVAIANGTTFGRGMKIAPHARYDDGLFDVVLVKDVARFKLLTTFQQVYSGTHLTQPEVMYAQAAQVDVTLLDTSPAPLKIDLDGEAFEGRELTFKLHPGLLRFLR